MPQLEIVDGRPLLPVLLPARRARARAPRGWSRPAGSGPWRADRAATLFDAFADVGSARLISDDRLYVGRTIRDRNGEWVLLAFHNRGADGRFVGAISDPMPLPRPW